MLRNIAVWSCERRKIIANSMTTVLQPSHSGFSLALMQFIKYDTNAPLLDFFLQHGISNSSWHFHPETAAAYAVPPAPVVDPISIGALLRISFILGTEPQTNREQNTPKQHEPPCIKAALNAWKRRAGHCFAKFITPRSVVRFHPSLPEIQIMINQIHTAITRKKFKEEVLQFSNTCTSKTPRSKIGN